MTNQSRIVPDVETMAPETDLVPRVRGDQTLALLRHGYGYLSRRMRELDSSAFQGRLFGARTVFLGGPAGARLFYDTERLQRAGAVPSPVRLSLFGKRTVHALDDEEHRHRKELFDRVAAPDRVAELAELTQRYWHAAARRWRQRSAVRLFDESVGVLGTAVCRWAGVPDPPRARLDDLATMVDDFGAVGFGWLRGRMARRRANRWAEELIEMTRAGVLHPEPETALRVVAEHRDRRGRLLSTRTAAEELINVLRPTVAVSWFVCFAAHATHVHPQWRHRLATSDEELVRAFVDEVRRSYPFAPLLAAKARRDFRWRGHDFRTGGRVVLDLYGTDHDPRVWDDPYRFDPYRFLQAQPDAFEFVPHGGGDRYAGHRCPGEDLTAELLVRAVRVLSGLDYHVPQRDLAIASARFPARLRDGFVMTNVVRHDA